MSSINISRPSVTIVASPSGKKFAIEWTHDSWSMKHQHLETFDSEKEAIKFGQAFIEDFNAEAKDIETKVVTPHNIANTLRNEGIIRSSRKVTAGRFGR